MADCKPGLEAEEILPARDTAFALCFRCMAMTVPLRAVLLQADVMSTVLLTLAASTLVLGVGI